MTARRRVSCRLHLVLLALLLLSPALLHAKQQPPPEPPADGAVEAASPDGDAEATAEEDDDSDPLVTSTPPDGRWLTDAEGRRYYEDTLPKGAAERIDANTVRSIWGIPVDVTREDAEFYYIKVYEVPPRPMGPEPTPPPPDPADVVDVPTRDTLRLVPWGQGLPKSGQWRQGFDIADMNGDGHLDVVSGPARKTLRAPVVFLGDGRGAFRPWRDARYPDRPYDYGDAKVADLNGDGKLDLVLGAHLRGLIALFGDGKGGFVDASAGLPFALPSSGKSAFSSQALRLVDWDGAGRPEIVALSEGPRLQLTPGAGPAEPGAGVARFRLRKDGTWERAGTIGRLFGASLALGDFNGDRLVDVATSVSGAGRKGIVNLHQRDGSTIELEVPEVRPGAYVRAVEAADFDRDRRTDLAVAYQSFEAGRWRSGVDVLYSRAGDRFERRTLVLTHDREGPIALASGDLDADKRTDLVVLSSDGAIAVFRGDARGFFIRETQQPAPFGPGCTASSARLADLDGDGRAELVASFARERAQDEPEVCPGEGGMAAWRAERKIDTPAPVR